MYPHSCWLQRFFDYILPMTFALRQRDRQTATTPLTQNIRRGEMFVDSLKKHQFSSIKWSKTTFLSFDRVHSFQAKKTNLKVAFRENSAIPWDILVSKYCKVLTLFCIELTIILHTDLAQCPVTGVTEEGIILHFVLICCFICHSFIHSSISSDQLTVESCLVCATAE